MTATAASQGKCFSDFDNRKNEEWIKRRRLRIEQVRRQSNEMAKILRQKTDFERKKSTEEFERIKESKENIWKTLKLMELETQLRDGLEGFGEAYKCAEAEPDPNEIIKLRRRINYKKAQERGEIAQQEERRRRKMEEEMKMEPIQRKKCTRKRENLRSTLICTLPLHRQSIIQREKEVGKPKTKISEKPVSTVHAKEVNRKKVSVKKVRKKRAPNRLAGEKAKKCACKTKVSDNQPQKTVWINLNDIQSSSDYDVDSRSTTRKPISRLTSEKTEKTEKTVEFYDYPSRYYCKSFKEFPNLVERIDSTSEPNANELSRIEEETELEEAKRKEEADMITEERGLEALKREKINRNYQYIITKLDELNRKDKIVRAQQRVNTNIVHMNDERLEEKTKLKQRLMDSKFEKIFYENTTAIPQANFVPAYQPNISAGGGDFIEAREQIPTKLSFTPDNKKTNTPVTPKASQVSKESTPDSDFHQEALKKKNTLLLDIDRALREGRLLRQTVSRNLEEKDNSEENKNKNEEEISNAESVEIFEIESSTSSKKEENVEKTVKSQDREVQTENITENEFLSGRRMNYLLYPGDDSVPVSTCTSYKSPPSVIHCSKLSNFLDYLEGISEKEDKNTHPEIRKKSARLLNYLGSYNEPEREEAPSSFSDELKQYIVRLLNMNRECIANLSVSSETISTPNITDLDVKEREEDIDRKSTTSFGSRGEEFIKQFRLKRADDLESSIRHWKNILAKNLPENQEEAEDEPDCPRRSSSETIHCEVRDARIERNSRQEYKSDVESEMRLDNDKNTADKLEESEAKVRGRVISLFNPQTETKYEEYTRKCSERIWELSQMLNKVRQDKERLLHSHSGCSNFGSSRNGKSSDGDSSDEDEIKKKEVKPFPVTHVVCPFWREPKRVQGSKNLVERHVKAHVEEAKPPPLTTTGDSNSLREPSIVFSDSFPDVMAELLDKNILTSPFKWTEGDQSLDLTIRRDIPQRSPSIETSTGNFRKKMATMKPFSRDGSGQKHRGCINKKWGRNGSRDLWKEQDESSVESINQALTNLGLNWAKSFLKKNEESKAINSSSGSDEENRSGSEKDGCYYY